MVTRFPSSQKSTPMYGFGQARPKNGVLFPLRSMCGLALGIFFRVPFFINGPPSCPHQGLLEWPDCFFLPYMGVEIKKLMVTWLQIHDKMSLNLW